MNELIDIREERDSVTFRVRVQPRASGNRLAGVVNGAVKVRLTAPPVDGEANDACLKFLAGLFGVPASAVEMVSGRTGRNKMVRVFGVGVKDALEKLKS